MYSHPNGAFATDAKDAHSRIWQQAKDAQSIKKRSPRQKKAGNSLAIENIFIPLHSQISNGTLADRLGNGLQNRVEQFDSARYLF